MRSIALVSLHTSEFGLSQLEGLEETRYKTEIGIQKRQGKKKPRDPATTKLLAYSNKKALRTRGDKKR
jgi:hypothetical protein